MNTIKGDGSPYLGSKRKIICQFIFRCFIIENVFHGFSRLTMNYFYTWWSGFSLISSNYKKNLKVLNSFFSLIYVNLKPNFRDILKIRTNQMQFSWFKFFLNYKLSKEIKKFSMKTPKFSIKNCRRRIN